MRNSFIRKVVLSSSPSENSQFIALAILSYNGHLAFCRNGDQSWTFIDEAQNYCEDVVYHNGLFYAVNKKGGVAVCELQGHLPPRVSIINAATEGNDGDMQYLVFLGKELLLVTRYLEFGYGDRVDDLNLVYKTAGFAASKMNWIELRWQKIETLAHQILFIGENSSLSISALDFPGCSGDSIYYTDDYSDSNYDGVFGKHDLGICKLWNRTIEPLRCYPRNSYSRLGWPPPIWVSLNPC